MTTPTIIASGPAKPQFIELTPDNLKAIIGDNNSAPTTPLQNQKLLEILRKQNGLSGIDLRKSGITEHPSTKSAEDAEYNKFQTERAKWRQQHSTIPLNFTRTVLNPSGKKNLDVIGRYFDTDAISVQTFPGTPKDFPIDTTKWSSGVLKRVEAEDKQRQAARGQFMADASYSYKVITVPAHYIGYVPYAVGTGLKWTADNLLINNDRQAATGDGSTLASAIVGGAGNLVKTAGNGMIIADETITGMQDTIRDEGWEKTQEMFHTGCKIDSKPPSWWTNELGTGAYCLPAVGLVAGAALKATSLKQALDENKKDKGKAWGETLVDIALWTAPTSRFYPKEIRATAGLSETLVKIKAEQSLEDYFKENYPDSKYNPMQIWDQTRNIFAANGLGNTYDSLLPAEKEILVRQTLAEGRKHFEIVSSDTHLIMKDEDAIITDIFSTKYNNNNPNGYILPSKKTEFYDEKIVPKASARFKYYHNLPATADLSEEGMKKLFPDDKTREKMHNELSELQHKVLLEAKAKDKTNDIDRPNHSAGYQQCLDWLKEHKEKGKTTTPAVAKSYDIAPIDATQLKQPSQFTMRS